MDKERIIELALMAYCDSCEKKVCKYRADFCIDKPCSWLEKFEKELKKKIKKLA